MGVLSELLEQLLTRVADALADTPIVARLGSLLLANAKPEHLLSILILALFTALPICTLMAAHLVMKRLTKRHAKVFVSFQHEHESLAQTLVTQMANAGLSPIKLPFAERPDHDSLLDDIRNAIRDCDVFLCIPGSHPSFVENEVSMAFGLEKPLLFVLPATDIPRLPNTAKKGYPVFVLERLQQDLFQTLIKFCSFLSSDLHSTLRLYQALLIFSAQCFYLVIPIYIASLLAINLIGVPRPTVAPHASVMVRLITDPAILCFVAASLLTFLFLDTLYFLKRLAFRSRIKTAISSKRFSAGFIPTQLEFSLKGADLLKLLYTDEILAEHELSK